MVAEDLRENEKKKPWEQHTFANMQCGELLFHVSMYFALIF